MSEDLVRNTTDCEATVSFESGMNNAFHLLIFLDFYTYCKVFTVLTLGWCSVGRNVMANVIQTSIPIGVK